MVVVDEGIIIFGFSILEALVEGGAATGIDALVVDVVSFSPDDFDAILNVPTVLVESEYCAVIVHFPGFPLAKVSFNIHRPEDFEYSGIPFRSPIGY